MEGYNIKTPDQLQICLVNIDDLKEYENNPRNNEEAALKVAASIENFGFKIPIVIDKDNIIVAGHTRIKAARILGIEQVPAIVADDLTPEQIKAFRLADNKTAEAATWDDIKLTAELQELAAMDIDFLMSDFGFADVEKIENVDVEEDEAPDPEDTETRAQPGDVWQLGPHRLICGDSTDPGTITALMAGKDADLCITDPPYNNDYVGKTAEKLTIANDKMSSPAFYQFLYDAFAAMAPKVKPGGAIYVFHAHMESINFIAAFQAAGFYLSQPLIWNKSQMALGRQDYHWKHEPILYGWKEGAPHYFTADRTQTTVIDDMPNLNKMSKEQLKDLCKKLLEPKDPATIIDCEKPLQNLDHPTMKPIKLIARLIRNSSRKGEIVIDPFGGSGSTLIACEQMGRICYTAELDPKYCDVIIERYENYTGDKAYKI